jgi:hypothetical protein
MGFGFGVLIISPLFSFGLAIKGLADRLWPEVLAGIMTIRRFDLLGVCAPGTGIKRLTSGLSVVGSATPETRGVLPEIGTCTLMYR